MVVVVSGGTVVAGGVVAGGSVAGGSVAGGSVVGVAVGDRKPCGAPPHLDPAGGKT